MTELFERPIAAVGAQPSGPTGRVSPITIERWQPALGAVVRGLRLEGHLDDGLANTLRDALRTHGLLSFEPGTVGPDNFSTLLQTFGEVSLYSGPKTPVAPASVKANIVDSRDRRFARNMLWHIDQAFRADPPKLTALYGKEVPAFGGDTLFSNATLAFESLDPLLVRYLDSLTAVHFWDATGHVADRFASDPLEASRQRAAVPPIETPLFRTHPETGRRQIYVNESYTTYIKDVPRAVSNALLSILFETLKVPEHLARYSWKQGAFIIWDNRVVQHRGVADFGDGKRVFYRACVA